MDKFNKNLIQEIKSGKISDTISYDEVLKLFLSCSRDNQEFFICYCLENKNEMESYPVYKKIISIYKLIKYKLMFEQKLTSKEIECFQRIYYALGINDLEMDKELLNKFCKKYIRNSKSVDIDRVFLVSWDIINLLNQKFQKSYGIKFLYDDTIKYCGWVESRFDDNDEKNININLYIIDLMIQKIKLSSYKKSKIITLYLINLLLHEYTHLLQNDYIIEHDDEISKNYIKEHVVKFVDRYFNNCKFYDKFHDNFITEKKANLYALENMFSYFNEYFDYDEDFNKKSKSFYSKSLEKKDTKNKEFKELFNDYYLYCANDCFDFFKKYMSKINKKKQEFKEQKKLTLKKLNI